MARKQIGAIALGVVAFGLGILVGYRHGQPHAGTSRFASGVRPQGVVAGCVDFHEAGAHTGQTGCVSGRVVRAFTSRAGNTFLDFCPDYRTCPFTSVIFASDRSKFGDLGSLEGRQVEIRGPIADYKGRAEINIHEPQQIHLVP
jgi:hypothetical protein